MLRSALFVGCLFALGLGGVIAVSGQADAAKSQQEVKGEAKAWALNEVHAAYDAEKKFSIVDVNDQFLIKSSASDTGNMVSFAFLDGARAKLKTCGADLKNGDPRTTWLQVTYSEPDAAGEREFTVRRTLDFDKHERVYSFSGSDGMLGTLEPGVTVGLENGLLVYEQAVGPIGLSGDTKAVRVTYQLSDQFSDVASSVEMGRNMWVVSTSKASSSGTPIYSVNSNAVTANGEGATGEVRDLAVVASPTRGPGIGSDADARALTVANNGPFMSPNNLQVKDEDAKLLCIAISCSFDFQCLSSTDPSCLCHDLDGPGPNLGICLI